MLSSPGPNADAVFVVWWYRLIGLPVFGLAGGDLVAELAMINVGFLVLAVPLTWIFGRSLRCATVRMDGEGVAVRGLFRTKRAAWTDVRSVVVTQGSGTGLPWRVPAFATAGGLIRADEIRSLRTGTIVDEVVREGRRRAGLGQDEPLWS